MAVAGEAALQTTSCRNFKSKKKKKTRLRPVKQLVNSLKCSLETATAKSTSESSPAAVCLINPDTVTAERHLVGQIHHAQVRLYFEAEG